MLVAWTRVGRLKSSFVRAPQNQQPEAQKCVVVEMPEMAARCKIMMELENKSWTCS